MEVGSGGDLSVREPERWIRTGLAVGFDLSYERVMLVLPFRRTGFGCVYLSGCTGGAVVTGYDEKGVVVFVCFLEIAHYASDLLVHVVDHGGVDGHAVCQIALLFGVQCPPLRGLRGPTCGGVGGDQSFCDQSVDPFLA